MKINKELLKGSFDMVILSVLATEPLYGYEIAKQIKQRSNDVFAMGEGTLYPLLHKLEQQGFLQAYWQEVGGRKRKYYGITRAGKTALKQKSAEWQEFSTAINAVMTQ